MNSMYSKFIDNFILHNRQMDWREVFLHSLQKFSEEEQLQIINQLNESSVGWKHFLNIPNDGYTLVIEDDFGTIALNLCRSFRSVVVLNSFCRNNYFTRFRKSALKLHNIDFLKGHLNSNLPFSDRSFKAVILTSHFNRLNKNSQSLILSEIYRVLSDDGIFALFAENKWSHIRLRSMISIKKKPNKFLYNAFSLKEYGDQLCQGGFKDIQSFKMIPDYNLCREIEAVNNINHVHCFNIKEWKKRLKYSNIFAPSFFFLSSKQRFDSKNMLEKIVADTQRKAGLSYSNKLVVKNYYLTSKGNTIIRYCGKKTDEKGFIIKIPINLSAHRHNIMNYRMLEIMHSSNYVPAWISSLIPAPISHSSFNGQSFFVESEIRGVPVAEVSERKRKRKLNSIVKEATEFLKVFHHSLCTFKIIDSEVIDRLINKKIQKLSDLFQNDIFTKTGKFLRNCLWRKKLPLICKHGDFCLPNLILEENTCELKGIIDWDNCCHEELPLVDLLNLLSSKYSLHGENYIGDKMIKIIIPYNFNSYESDLIKNYLNYMSIDKNFFLPLSIYYWLDHVYSQIEYEFITMNKDWIQKNIFNAISYINDEVLA